MDSSHPLNQFKYLFVQGLKSDLADKEKLVTPFLFALTLMLLINFVFEVNSQGFESQLFVAQIYLTSLIALQMSYVRIFSKVKEDRVFELLQASPIAPSSWFLSQWALSFLYSACVFVPAVFIAWLFVSSGNIDLWQYEIWLSGFLALSGLSSLGVLLSALTLNASGRDMLFPLLYFPLSIPVLLSSVQASLIFLTSDASNGFQWLGLMAGFDVLYFTLALLLFGDLVKN